MQETALYLEADEDITSAIDKLSKAPASSVQIVVPKRSTMLQSIINLKLLKKAAATHHKELVLVTGDKIATDLAARVGLAVAPSLGAKAVLGEAVMPAELKSNEEVIEASDPAPSGPPPTPETAAPVAKATSRLPMLKHRELTDAPTPAASPAPDIMEPAFAEVSKPSLPSPPGLQTSGSSGHKPKVPNFNLFTSRLKWVGLAVILIVGYFVFMAVFTTAKVTLFAAGTQVGIDTSFAVDPSAQTSDSANSVLAGRSITSVQSLSGSFTPTGSQDVGTKASGTMTIYNSYDLSSHTLVAGTRFQAPDGNVFLSTADASVPGQTIGGCPGHCQLVPGQTTVSVQASANGDKYNEAAADYAIPGLPAGEQSTTTGIYAKGAQMSGGTSKVVTVVAQSDVDTAKAALLSKDAGNITSDLKKNLPSGYTEVPGSVTTTTQAITPSPAVGTQAETATLQLEATYTALAVKTSDYDAFIHAAEQKQVGASNQIYDDGLAGAQVTSTGQDSSGRQSFHLTAAAYSGAKLDTATIATQLKGKRYGDAATIAAALPGVQQATINVWPPWAGSLPSSVGKIKVVIQVAKQ